MFYQVWKTPLTTLADEYGVSDVAVAKSCKRLNVPRPPRGYWAQIAAGKKVRKPNLPPIVDGGVTSTTIDPLKSLRYPKAGDFDKTETQAIEVPETLHGCHTIVSATKRCLESSKPSENGLLRSPDDGTLTMAVSRHSIHRALRLMEALIRAIEANGWQFLGKGEREGMRVNLNGESINLEIEEKIGRAEIPPAPGESRWWKKYEYLPTGRLTIRLSESFYRGIRYSWSDGKIQKLEFLLTEILAGIVVAAEYKRSARLEHEARQRRWAEEERIRNERAARIALERKRRSRLTEALDGWRAAEELRRFCEEVEKRRLNGSLEVDDASEWLAWARGIASKSDPFENGYFPDAISEQGLDSSID